MEAEMFRQRISYRLPHSWQPEPLPFGLESRHKETRLSIIAPCLVVKVDRFRN